jgi:SAM-dependent methyltransferase
LTEHAATLACERGHRYARTGAIVDLLPAATAPGFGRLRALTYNLTFDWVNTRRLFGATPAHLAELHRVAARAARGGALLDVACGTGRWAIPELRDAGVRLYVGVDASRPMLELAAADVAATGVDALLVHAGAEKLPLADGSVDAAISSLGLQYVADHGPALAELRRVLRPGGALAAVAPCLGLRERYDRRHRERARKDYPLDRERWPQQLGAAGFGDVQVTTVGALLFTHAKAA